MSETKSIVSTDTPVPDKSILTNEELSNLQTACIRVAKEEKTSHTEMSYLLNLSIKLEQMKEKNNSIDTK